MREGDRTLFMRFQKKKKRRKVKTVQIVITRFLYERIKFLNYDNDITKYA